jgi:UDP-N-acetylmuramoylalanine--D-glutamate ligase
MGHRAMNDAFQFGAGETILIIGLGRSGLASLEVLRRQGAVLYATDEKPVAELAEQIAMAGLFGARFVEPGQLAGIAGTLTCAVLSPGVPPTSPVVRSLHESNVPVFGEIELAYRLCKAPIVAVTGTKGKSTTTALIGHLLRACGRKVRVGGNIGNPLIKEVWDAAPEEWIVAEVSSFQLETIRAFKPRVAVLLNLMPDHLDRYHSMDEYAEAKYRIFANQSMMDWFVGNLDDPRIRELHWRRGDARAQARQLWYALENFDQATMYVRDGTITYAPVAGDPRPIGLLRRDELPLAGEHNVQNAMAALLAAIAAECPPLQAAAAMKGFQPMPHRLQTVAAIDGVRYVDDSKATNPASVLAALRTYDAPIVLIAGGRSKGAEFGDLGAEIAKRAAALIAIGEAAGEIRGAVEGIPTIEASTIEEAVQRARELAVPGGVVLLSPGCASFDMFASAEERGDRFAAAVAALRETAGA